MITIKFIEEDKTTSIIQTKFFQFQRCSDISENYRNFLPDLSKAYEKDKDNFVITLPIEKIHKEVIYFDIISIEN